MQIILCNVAVNANAFNIKFMSQLTNVR